MNTISITPQFIRDYLDSKFSNISKISGNGEELLLPSLFVEGDLKYHFSINLESGLWRDFKAGLGGNFVQLYAHIEELSYKAAETRIIFRTLLDDPVEPQNFKKLKAQYSIEEERSHFIPIGVQSLWSDNEIEAELATWLVERKLFDTENQPFDDFYYCTEGRYKERLIIPYRIKDKLVYFQARAYGDRQPKYLNPSTDHGVKSHNVLYPFDHSAEYVVICEGPLDAISLQLQGVNATCSQGSIVSREQMRQLKEFGGRLIIGYDNDEAGESGARKFDALSKKFCIPLVYRLSPPNQYKDWNETHADGWSLMDWMISNTVMLNFDYSITQQLSSL